MSNNDNNYIGHELDWTDWTSVDVLPVGVPLVFKTAKGELMFGQTHLISHGKNTMCVVDGAFHFDRLDDLETCQWASLAFVFKTENH